MTPLVHENAEGKATSYDSIVILRSSYRILVIILFSLYSKFLLHFYKGRHSLFAGSSHVQSAMKVHYHTRNLNID